MTRTGIRDSDFSMYWDLFSIVRVLLQSTHRGTTFDKLQRYGNVFEKGNVLIVRKEEGLKINHTRKRKEFKNGFVTE